MKFPHFLCISLYLIFISVSLNQFRSHNLQYYKTLNITRKFSKNEIASANRKILRDLHPDYKTGDQMKYMIHSETAEAFKMMPKSLLKIYNMFHEDIFMLFSAKSLESSFQAYHSKKENDSIMLHGFALLLTLFILKFAHIKSQKVKTIILLNFFVSFLLEAVFYNYFNYFEDQQTIMIGLIDSQTIFDKSTYYEIFFGIQISLFFVQQLGVIISLPLIVDKPIVIISQIEDLQVNVSNELWRKKKLNKTEGKI